MRVSEQGDIFAMEGVSMRGQCVGDDRQRDSEEEGGRGYNAKTK